MRHACAGRASQSRSLGSRTRSSDGYVCVEDQRRWSVARDVGMARSGAEAALRVRKGKIKIKRQQSDGRNPEPPEDRHNKFRSDQTAGRPSSAAALLFSQLYGPYVHTATATARYLPRRPPGAIQPAIHPASQPAVRSFRPVVVVMDALSAGPSIEAFLIRWSGRKGRREGRGGQSTGSNAMRTSSRGRRGGFFWCTSLRRTLLPRSGDRSGRLPV